MQDTLLALLHIGAGMLRRELARIGQCDGNQGTLLLGQLAGAESPIVKTDGFDAIDALARLNGIQVDLHDALL